MYEVVVTTHYAWIPEGALDVSCMMKVSDHRNCEDLDQLGVCMYVCMYWEYNISCVNGQIILLTSL